MLTTLIYRSQIPLTHEINLSLLVEKANVNNMSHGVSGILLFKDNVILQVLEGDESILEQLFSKIKHDSRHFGVVELMRDYAPRRRFENVGMMYFDLDTLEADAVLKTVRQLSKLKSYLLTEERVYKFIHTFITQKRALPVSQYFQPEKWSVIPQRSPFHTPERSPVDTQCCQFAFQPIIAYHFTGSAYS